MEPLQDSASNLLNGRRYHTFILLLSLCLNRHVTQTLLHRHGCSVAGSTNYFMLGLQPPAPPHRTALVPGNYVSIWLRALGPYSCMIMHGTACTYLVWSSLNSWDPRNYSSFRLLYDTRVNFVIVCTSLLPFGMSFRDQLTTPFKSNLVSVFPGSGNRETEKEYSPLSFFFYLLSLYNCPVWLLQLARQMKKSISSCSAHTCSLFLLLNSCYHLGLVIFPITFPCLAQETVLLVWYNCFFLFHLLLLTVIRNQPHVSPGKLAGTRGSRWCCGDGKGTGTLSSSEFQVIDLGPPLTASFQFRETPKGPSEHGEWSQQPTTPGRGQYLSFLRFPRDGRHFPSQSATVLRTRHPHPRLICYPFLIPHLLW